MKNSLKKLLCLVTAVCMCMTFMTVAFAETEEDCCEGVAVICPEMCDIDLDGMISSCDARTALRCAVGLDKLEGKAFARADYDADGKVNAADARMILRTAVGLEKVPPHVADKNIWAADKKCTVCGNVIEAAKMSQVMDAANKWAAEIGIDGFIKGSAGDGAAAIEINVDGIWAENDLDAIVFDGFLTALGEAINEYFGDADVTIDGQNVFADGKLQNTAVKNALFDIGAGFFYKVANLKEDGVYGVYALVIDGEEIELTVKFTGAEENLAKVKSFCQTISEHIAADVVDGNLVIDVYAPDALKSLIVEKAGADAKASLDALTIAEGFSVVKGLDVEDAFGSQASAVNKLCAFICELSPFVNKVLSKTDAQVELQNGEKIALVGGTFDCNGDNSFNGLVYGFTEALSEELLDTTVGAFAVEGEEYYSVPVHLTVDMSSLGLMAGETIEETVIINIHVFDNN